MLLKLFKILFVVALVFGPLWVLAQNNDTEKGKPRKIEIRNSNTLEVTEVLGPDVKVLRGDVEFYHDSAFMYCDSAYYNTKENEFRAYGRVHIMRQAQDGDTVNLWGDSLQYDGATKYAKIRENVKMTKDSMVMLTQNIDYDMNKNVANYFDGGITFTGEDTLISDLGYFYPQTNDLVYHKDVEIHNPKFKMYSDTLTHNIKSKRSTFQGPTEIVGQDNYLYSERGWYNHNADIGELTKNSYLISKEHKLVGDTIYYDRNKKYGLGKSNVEIIDTSQNIQLTGNKAWYYEIPERSLLTDSALMKYISKNDTLFLHADTISSITDTIFNNIEEGDTCIYRIIKAFHKVKLFRHDLQTMCDSLVYNLYDSIITMMGTPAIWSDNNQLTATTIKLYTIENNIDMVEMLDKAFIISQVDSLEHYNQIFGKNMVGYLDSNKIQEIEVISSSNTIYYTQEDSIVTGMNQVSGEDMRIIFVNGKVNRIWFFKNPAGIMHPLSAIRRSNRYLEGFVWYNKHRPKCMQDIFTWGEITEQSITKQLMEQMEQEDKDKEEEARLNGETIE